MTSGTGEHVPEPGAAFEDVDLSGGSISHADPEGMTIGGIPVTGLLAKWQGG